MSLALEKKYLGSDKDPLVFAMLTADALYNEVREFKKLFIVGCDKNIRNSTITEVTEKFEMEVTKGAIKKKAVSVFYINQQTNSASIDIEVDKLKPDDGTGVVVLFDKFDPTLAKKAVNVFYRPSISIMHFISAESNQSEEESFLKSFNSKLSEKFVVSSFK